MKRGEERRKDWGKTELKKFCWENVCDGADMT